MRQMFASIQAVRFIAVVCVLMLAGCAYLPGYGDRQIPGGYRAVAVPVFKNITHEAGIEVFFTNAFIREMQRSQIGVLSDKDAAQVTLEGSVDGVTYTPTGPVPASAENRLPVGTSINEGYRIGVASTIRLRRNSDQKILWEGAFSKETSYKTPRIGYEPLTGANALYNHSAHYQNIELLANDMMIEAHDRLTENF